MSKNPNTTTPRRAASTGRGLDPPPRPRRVSRACRKGPQLGSVIEVVMFSAFRTAYSVTQLHRVTHFTYIKVPTTRPSTTSVYQYHQQQLFLATPGGSNRSAQRPRFALPHGRPEVAIALPITPATVKARGNGLWGSDGKKRMARPSPPRRVCYGSVYKFSTCEPGRRLLASILLQG